jgi:hypothetical protein
MRYLVADAQNLATQMLVNNGQEWLFLHEDDVVLPPTAFCQLNDYINGGDIPVVSGLYFTKANPTEPVLYRGRGNSFYAKWKLGDKVWADGVPTGCLLIHSSILKLMYKESEEYIGLNGVKLRKVFETPSKTWYDPESVKFRQEMGTSDLAWCSRVIKEKVLKRAGWPDIGKKKYPFLCDTTLFCKHIDLASGKLYPEAAING